MRDFVRAIRAALRAMKQWVWKVVDGALQLVQSEPVGGGMAPGGDDMDVGQAEPMSEISRFERIRQLAIELVRNPNVPPAEMLRGIGPTTAAWLAAMDSSMLLKIGTASDESLAQHMIGKKAIRGVLAYDGDSIADYQRAMSRPEPDMSLADDLDEALSPAI